MAGPTRWPAIGNNLPAIMNGIRITMNGMTVARKNENACSDGISRCFFLFALLLSRIMDVINVAIPISKKMRSSQIPALVVIMPMSVKIKPTKLKEPAIIISFLSFSSKEGFVRIFGDGSGKGYSKFIFYYYNIFNLLYKIYYI